MAALEKRFDRQALTVAAPEPAFRAPPANIEAEQALLGAILVNNDAFDRVSDFLKPEHFAEELHRRILRDRRPADSRREARHAGHAQDLSGRARPRRHDHSAISGASGGGGDHHHQCLRLRPRHPRSRRAPRADPYRRATWSTPPMTPASITSPRAQIEEAERKLYAIAETGRYEGGFHRFRRSLDQRRGHGGEGLGARGRAVRRRPPACTISTA